MQLLHVDLGVSIAEHFLGGGSLKSDEWPDQPLSSQQRSLIAPVCLLFSRRDILMLMVFAAHQLIPLVMEAPVISLKDISAPYCDACKAMLKKAVEQKWSPPVGLSSFIMWDHTCALGVKVF
jgi:hypothetical protein